MAPPKLPKSKTLEPVDIPIDLLRPNPRSPFEETEEQFKALCASIKQHGILEPLHVVETDHESAPYVILGGRHRWLAAKEVGLAVVPGIVLSKEKFSDEDIQTFTTFHLNFRGSINVAKMAPEYQRLVAKLGSDKAVKDALGFADTPAWERLTKQIQQSASAALPGGASGPAAKALKKAMDKAKPGADLGSILGRIMNQHGASLQHGFMVFTFEGQEHIYVPMDEELREVVKEFCEEAERQGVHLARLLAPALRGALDQLYSPVDEDGSAEDSQSDD